MKTARPKLNIAARIFLLTLAFACASAPLASESVTSYAAPVTVNDFFRWGDTIWVATSGGVRIHDLRSDEGTLVADSRIFPDMHLTAVVRDSRGNMWFGSREGYLYRRTPRGQFTVFSNYKLADWGILSLYGHSGLIVVGSNRGVSLFDPAKGVALRNATQIADFSNPRVNTIISLRDTLFLGCEEGIAYLDSLHIVPLAQRNFYYSGIWKTVRGGSVASFVNINASIRSAPAPAVIFRDRVFMAGDSGWVLNNGTRWLRVHSSSGPTGGITRLYNEGDRRLWIGTEDHYYFTWDGEDLPEQQWIMGFSMRRASRVVAAPNGDVWFLPVVPHPNVTWHHGIYRFDGRNWHMYNDHAHAGRFGYIGDGDALAGVPGRNGTFWAGMSGGNVKHIKPDSNTAAQLIVGNRAFRNFAYIADGVGEIQWGKVDALAMDSTGYLWISVFDSELGSLICYDPSRPPVASLEAEPARAGFRRFFTEPPFITRSITAMAVDGDNRIFAYGLNNALTVFRHGGDPLTGGIVIDTVYANFGVVRTMVAADDGAVYILGNSGLLRVAAGTLALESVDETLTNVTSMALRGNVAWFGSQTNGVLRYDLDSGEKRWIDESSGLPSNNVSSLAMERRSGRLWVATEAGISQIDVGRETRAARGRGLHAFPNVFSASRSTQGAERITFAGLERRASVSVYTINGSLVAKVDAQQFNENEWRAFWAPRRNLTPGTYIAVAKPSGRRAKIILKP
jgi:ligand-binding sensor domain-containing protein